MGLHSMLVVKRATKTAILQAARLFAATPTDASRTALREAVAAIGDDPEVPCDQPTRSQATYNRGAPPEKPAEGGSRRGKGVRFAHDNRRKEEQEADKRGRSAKEAAPPKE